MRIIVEYKPNISSITEAVIKTNLKPVMVSLNQESYQFDLEEVVTKLSEIQSTYESTWKTDDIKTLVKLIEEHNVQYIEI